MHILKKMNNIRLKLILTFLYLAFIILMYYFQIPCLIKNFSGIPCPGCGMTRAVLSAFRFDFKSAFHFHPMFWSLPILYIYILVDGKLIKYKNADSLVLISILCGYFINWIFSIL